MEEHEERGLEGILGILPVMEHASAHAEHQRPVSPDQCRERCLIPMGHKALEKISVRRVPIVMPANDATDMADQVL
jgi:hypothetical protein